MRRLLITFGVFLLLLVMLFVQWKTIQSVKADRDVYKANNMTLFNGVAHYKTKDSLNAVYVGELKVSRDEYEKYYHDYKSEVDKLKVKNRDLSSLVAQQTLTINKLRGKVYDSIVYIKGIPDTLKCVSIKEKWFSLDGCMNDSVFLGTHISCDSLLIAETVKYKRFWGFLWKTSKIKDRKIDVVSKNPDTKITGIEFVTIRDD